MANNGNPTKNNRPAFIFADPNDEEAARCGDLITRGRAMAFAGRSQETMLLLETPDGARWWLPESECSPAHPANTGRNNR